MSDRYGSKLSRVFSYKKKNLPGLIIKGAWLTVATICIIVAIVVFALNVGSYGFGAWLMAGAICCIPIIGAILTFLIDMKNDGSYEGSRHLTTTVYADSYSARAYTTDHRYLYAFIYLLVGLFFSLLLGPILCVAIFVWKSIDFVRNILDLVKER